MDNERLISAAQTGNIQAINALVKAGANVNHADNDGRTALFTAALHGRVEAIALLLKAGAKVNHADNRGKTALSWAARDGKVEAIAALVKAGAKVNHAQNDGETALFEAAKGGHVETIAALVKAGANVNHADIFGVTALLWAAQDGNVKAIAALVKAGAKVNDADLYGETPLFHAAQYGKVEAIAALVKAKANVNHADNDGETALFWAAKGGEVEAIAALVKAGANVNHADTKGKTALSQYGSNMRVKETLIRLGATVGMITPTMQDFVNADSAGKKELLQFSISLEDYIVDMVERKTNLDKRNAYNISLDTFSDDFKMGMFFRYGWDTVVSISFAVGGSPVVRHLQAQAPICAGDGRVIYTKTKYTGESHVYENSIDLAPETEIELCHSLSSPYEKNWGCFGRTGQASDSYFIVYSVIPLRIFQVSNRRECVELPAVEVGYAFENPPDKMVVKKEYPNFEAIERMFVDERDWNGTSIFRGGTRGIDFGVDEYLFVGHVTLHKEDHGCFPSWFVQRNAANNSNYGRMYFMYFFTVRFVNGMFKLSRMSSCFQPPSVQTFHKIVFPCGIARRGTDIVVSFGRDDSDCLITSYSAENVSTMLAPVQFWNENNYVFHPNYASSLRRAGSISRPAPERSILRTIMPRGRVGLTGTSPDSDGCFNPAITNIGTAGGDKFLTAWRKLNGSVETWKGYNQVAMEACSLKIKDGGLVYTRDSEIIEFQAGTTTVGGEDPRLLTENGCPLVMVNDFDSDGNRRMYLHNLSTDDSAMTIHPFCHNISGKKEKNWGPFYVDGELHFVYDVDPLVVGKVDGGKFQCPQQTPVNIGCTKVSTRSTDSNLDQIFKANGLMMRGGTPGLPLGDGEYLFVGHAVQEADHCFPDFTVQRSVNASDDPDWRKEYSKFYTAFFYTIGKDGGDDWVVKRLSCCSHLPKKRENFTKIHFPSGLAKANLGGEFADAFIVSFGEKDVYGGFCAVNRRFLNYVLRPVSEWNVNNYVVDVNYFVSIAVIDPEE